MCMIWYVIGNFGNFVLCSQHLSSVLTLHYMYCMCNSVLSFYDLSVHAPVTVATACVRCVVLPTTLPQVTAVTPVRPQRPEKNATNNLV